MNPDALILTKLQYPAIGPDILPRNHLVDRLNKGRFRKLTLVSAPAGYGKSVLASVWRESCDMPMAWLSLDRNDNDLGVFLNYLIGAVQTLFPQAFPETDALLNGLQLPTSDIVAKRLVNEAAVLPQPFIFVLDDYHEIHNQEIHQLLDALIRYLPSTMHAVVISRQDPPFDLHNLRAKDQVTEIRLGQLCFSKDEAHEYLKMKLGDGVRPELAARLLERTEGWAAGLRLAVLALQNHERQERVLETIAGTNQYIMSYLVSEVLAREPAAVQRFLLQTSLLDRFCAPLCDALLRVENEDQPRSQEVIDHLLRDNLFVIALDQQGKWFRYHHLFQDLLRHQLRLSADDDAVAKLHVRASNWLAAEGFIDEALDHAFLADNADLAADIVARARFDLMNKTQWQRLEHLLSRFTPVLIDHYPDLLMVKIWLLYHHDQLNKVPAALDHLEAVISGHKRGKETFDYLQGEISALRSLLLCYAIDTDGAAYYAERSLALTPPELWIVRVLARLTLACARQMTGDLSGAYAAIYEGFEVEPAQGDVFTATVLVTLCFIGWFTADLNSVQHNANQAAELAEKARSPGILGYGRHFAGVAAYQQNDLRTARAHFVHITERPYSTYDETYVFGTIGLALICQAEGQAQAACDAVEAALTYVLATGNNDLLLALQAFQAELALRQGQLRAASEWARRQEPLPLSRPMTKTYAPQMTLVKVWIAEDTPRSLQKAAALLDELETFLEFTHNRVFMMEALALQAMLCQKLGDEDTARTKLEGALTLAVPGKFVRFFADLGPKMARLLHSLPVAEPELAAHKKRIIAAIGAESPRTSMPPTDGHPAPPINETLTDREMDVLLLLQRGQTDRQIAAELVISHHTVRTHTRNIYAKLGVRNRRQATLRAEQLGLLKAT